MTQTPTKSNTTRPRHYYNLFLAVSGFNSDPEKVFLDFKAGDGIERIYKKDALKELRFLLPNYRKFKDDKELLAKIVENSSKDVFIRQLIRESLQAAGVQEESQEEGKEEKEKEKKEEEVKKETPLYKEPIRQPEVPKVIEQAFEKTAQTQLNQEVPEEALREPTPQPQPSGFSRPSIPQPIKRFGADMGSRAKIAGRKMASGAIRGAGSMGKGLLNAGGGLLRGGLGAGSRLAAGTALRAGAGAAIAGVGWPVLIAIIVVIVLILLLFFVFGLPDSNALLNKFAVSPQGQAAYGSNDPNYTIGGVNYCDLTYRGQARAIKSQKLKALFEEVSKATNVPAVVLASVAMHESHQFVLNAEDDHDAFSNKNFSGVDCEPHFPTSPTGALGLMQIQAPANLKPQKAPNYNPNAFSAEGVKIGLELLNRSFDSLTTRDFCNIRTNLFLGAGVLIAKNGGKAPTTQAEIKEAVCRYYGQCEYGIYNYGEEVARDFENCQRAPNPNTASASNIQASFCPIPNGTVTCGTYFTPVNGCGHCGVGYEENMAICRAYPNTKYGMDIAGNAGQQVLLPTIEGKSVKWEWVLEEGKAVDSIQRYAGTNIESGKRYILQLHHSQPGSGARGIHFSGEVGGKICNSCNHVHVQLAEGGREGTPEPWVDSAKYFCAARR